MSATRIANLLIDTADRLAEARTGEAAWDAINGIARRIGANAVNAGAFLRSDPQIAWMRSSMNADWLGDYAGEGFFEQDPLLRDALAHRPPPVYDVALRERTGCRDYSALHHGMMDHGYNFLVTRNWYDGDAAKCLVLSCRDDPTDLFGPGTQRAFSAISAMLALRLAPPEGVSHDGWAFGADWSRLDDAERTVMSLLANGLTEAAIAEKLRSDPPRVRRLMEAARRKMRAESTHQALALAMTRGLISI